MPRNKGLASLAVHVERVTANLGSCQPETKFRFLRDMTGDESFGAGGIDKEGSGLSATDSKTSAL